MARQSVRGQIAESVWRERIEEWQQSGQRQKEFCRGRGISVSSFSRWKCELLGRQVDGSCDSVAVSPSEPASGLGGESGLPFAEVPWPSSRNTDLELVLPSGWSIRLGSRFEAETLQRLLGVLGGGPC